jgi:hypothetical protein
MSTVSRNCRNHGQRPQLGGMITPHFFGSRGRAPGALRLLLPLSCSNSRRTCSVRLCESKPREDSHMKSVGQHGSSKIPAKIAVSQGWQHPVEVPSSSRSTPFAPLGVDWQNRDKWKGLFVRASAHFFPQICIRAEARRGFFPPLYLQPHTGPP